MATDHVDVLIVGAGLSGIGAAWHLKTLCPGKTWLILEGRDAIGGTWDLFRYPGVRSDSDMYTLGYSFRPWTEAKAIADGPAILEYVRETAAEGGIDQRIRFRHRVRRASWSSANARWTVEAECDGEAVTLTCGFLFMCSGYYNYESGYTPNFPGVDRFKGRIAHPQKWTGDIDYAGKRVVVIGSGATAVTLVPAMTDKAAHVTMLQRSPTYMVSRPSEDAIANRLRARLPVRMAYALTRWKNVLFGMYIFRLCRRRPEQAKRRILGMLRAELPPEVDFDTHFKPRYNPWDQRLCLVPDSDFFRAMKKGKVSVVTDQIESFTETGIALKSGKTLEADLIVTATGLDLLFLGGVEVEVDGVKLDVSKTMNYKGMMLKDVPNLAITFGYTNASWTLKADLISSYVCRLINHMDKTGTRVCTPRLTDATVEPETWVDFSSGYFARAIHRFPKQGSKVPWKLHQNYVKDLLALRFGNVEDGAMKFSGARTEEVA